MSYTTSVLLRTQVYLYLLNISLGFCVLSVENETKKDQQQRQKGTGQSWEVPHGTAETDLFRSLLDEMMKLLVCHLPTLGLQFSWSCCGNSVEGQHSSWKNPCQRNTCSAESWVGGQTTSLFQLSRDLLQAYGLSVNKTRGWIMCSSVLSYRDMLLLNGK